MPGPAIAQHLVGGFAQGKGRAAVALSYTRESFDQFYLGTQKTPIAIRKLDDIVIESVNLYAAYGVTDQVDVVVNLPYISAQSRRLDSDLKVRERNLQNGAAVVQWHAYRKPCGGGTLSATGAVGVSTPLSSYRTNLIYGIGNQSSHLNPSLLLQYQRANGLFATGQGGYSFRSSQVPDAVLLAAKVGYAGARFYADASLTNQTSTSGIDIGGPGFTPARFPETRVSTTNLGVSVYVPVAGPAGLSLGGGTRIDGRNAGALRWGSAGLVVKL
ncbi:hypothetical protein BEN47_17465 [Hymenobacter lapidarius]|uniref:Uncharacterized protein n=1 Tax=Hymenobacter lapidarius TaxID=1908237 RepID=A0A1G1SY39_9BACT|nr:hypothetical protein BEN47_17465 [Hymenobacter lapidarius]